MKVGLVARCEDRGLGNMTWEWAQHMRPDRVLLVVPDHPIRQRFDRFPDATRIGWKAHGDQRLDERVVRAWLDGLDVVYSAETMYDWRLCDWARDADVRTVVHVMPEYFRHGAPNPPASPDAWWAPTRWRLNLLPAQTRVVPVPIAVERFPLPKFHVEHRAPRWLHAAGARAAADRNGTRIVIRSLASLRREHRVVIRTQNEPVTRSATGDRVTVETITQPVDEYWELYGDADALLLPRRYAGLSLPALEAMAAGLALVMSDVEPQHSEWPIIGLPVVAHRSIRTGAGLIRLSEVAPRQLAARMDWLADHPDEIVSARRRARAFAESQSWDVLRPTIDDELERVCA